MAPRRRWVWFFLVLAILAAAAVILPFVIGPWLRPQLRPEQLQAARQRWEQNGPRDYDLVYAKTGSASGTYRVEVRGGRVVRVVEVTSAGSPQGRELEAWQLKDHSMEALFDDIERFLEMKAQLAGVGLSANFDAQDGHLRSYIFNNPATRQTVQVRVEKFEPRQAGSSFLLSPQREQEDSRPCSRCGLRRLFPVRHATFDVRSSPAALWTSRGHG